MKVWILKAVIQKVISFLPIKHKLNFLFQKYITKGVFLSDLYFTDRLIHFKTHYNAFNKYSKSENPSTYLELGTGWYPVIPICFFLVGSDKICTIDISKLMTKERLQTTLIKFKDYYDENKLAEYIQIDKDRWKLLNQLIKDKFTFESMLEKLQISYFIGDARVYDFEESFDLISSNNTFEHVYPKVLPDLIKRFDILLKNRRSVQSHFIDMSDHFAHFDKSINIYNFLKFKQKEWDWIDNSIQPQNRLRFEDYKAMIRMLGIEILGEEFRPGDKNALKNIPLAEEFKHLTMDQIAISHGYLFLSKRKLH